MIFAVRSKFSKLIFSKNKRHKISRLVVFFLCANKSWLEEEIIIMEDALKCFIKI